MTRLIDADALVDQLEREAADEWNRNTSTNWANAFCVFVDRLDESPTIDAAPVRRGEWLEVNPMYKGVYQCSVCGTYMGMSTRALTEKRKDHYCSECGANMRGETHGTD